MNSLNVAPVGEKPVLPGVQTHGMGLRISNFTWLQIQNTIAFIHGMTLFFYVSLFPRLNEDSEEHYVTN
jgi:hypothetical protein